MISPSDNSSSSFSSAVAKEEVELPLLLSQNVADDGSDVKAPCGGGEGAAVRVGDDEEE